MQQIFEFTFKFESTVQVTAPDETAAEIEAAKTLTKTELENVKETKWRNLTNGDHTDFYKVDKEWWKENNV